MNGVLVVNILFYISYGCSGGVCEEFSSMQQYSLGANVYNVPAWAEDAEDFIHSFIHSFIEKGSFQKDLCLT